MRARESLDGIAQAREVEVANLDRRNNDRETWSAGFTRAHAHGATHRIEVVQHEDRRLVEAKILDRLRDLASLYEERAVARESRIENRSRIDGTKVPEARDEEAALAAGDEVALMALDRFWRSYHALEESTT